MQKCKQIQVIKPGKIFLSRHEGDEQPETQTKDDEEKKLKKVLKRIERKKRSKEKYKEKQKIKHEIIAHAIEKKTRRKQIKASIINVPENTQDEFIDSHIEEIQKEEENTIKSKSSDLKKNINGEIDGYTVLGNETFKKNEKVRL